VRADKAAQVCKISVVALIFMFPSTSQRLILYSWGCFRLTDPPGKQAILACTRPGIFHPHDVQNVYTEALKPGHVVELSDAPLDVVDMRVKRGGL
jgi:hypothetical protein